MTARIRIPKDAKRGEVIRVRLLVQHPMETGYRHDEVGHAIKRNVIREISCRYNGAEVFRAEMSPGIAANPFLEFPIVAAESGELEFTWVDDDGLKGRATEPISVAG